MDRRWHEAQVWLISDGVKGGLLCEWMEKLPDHLLPLMEAEGWDAIM